MDVEGSVGGPCFLDPIPEDVSVAGILSKASAVASSESGSARSNRRWGPGKHSKSTSNAMPVAADDISDVNASLGGAFEHRAVEHTNRSLFRSPNCKKHLLIVLGCVLVIGVGAFTILLYEPRGNNPQESNAAVSRGEDSGSSAGPTMDLFPLHGGFTKSYSDDEIQTLDNTFLKVFGTTDENLHDMNTPEGHCHDWMIHSDNPMALENDYERRAQQRYILCILYQATNGDFWINRNNWMDVERSECEWHGIACDDNELIIEEIDLSGNNITGPLPYEIGSLSNLKSLNIASNALRGTIPERLFDVMTELKELRAYDNTMSGTLPTVWNTSDLIELDLAGNLWTGVIPQELWDLTSLKTLFLNHCNLTGPLPSSSRNVKMHRLWLHSNSLTGSIPPNFGWNWTKLYSIKLNDNSLTGGISMEQCSQWEKMVPMEDPTNGKEISLLSSESSGTIEPSEVKEWKLEADCRIDCACCTNTNCASSDPDTDRSIGGRR